MLQQDEALELIEYLDERWPQVLDCVDDEFAEHLALAMVEKTTGQAYTGLHEQNQ